MVTPLRRSKRPSSKQLNTRVAARRGPHQLDGEERRDKGAFAGGFDLNRFSFGAMRNNGRFLVLSCAVNLNKKFLNKDGELDAASSSINDSLRRANSPLANGGLLVSKPI
jgi:hypothetical protein